MVNRPACLLSARAVHARAINAAHRRFDQTWIKLHAKTQPEAAAVCLLISLSDFLPKFRYFNISPSVFCAN